MATARIQPQYDFLTAPSSPPTKRSAGEIRRPSSVKADEGNESLRAQIYKLQYEVESLKQERDLTALRREEELRSVHSKAEADFRRAQASESETNLTSRKIAALSQQLQEAEQQYAADKLDLEKKLRTAIESQRTTLEEADEARAELSSQQRQFKYQLSEIESKFGSVNKSQEDVKSELEAKTALLQSTQHTLQLRENEIGECEEEILRLKTQSGDADTLAVVKRELSEQVAHIRQLESTNRTLSTELKKFRGQQQAIDVVEEEKRQLLGKLEMMQVLRRELSEVQLHKQILEDERKSWTAYLESASSNDADLRFDTPEDLAKAYMHERLERVSLLDQLGNIAPELSAKDEIIQGLENEKSKLRDEIKKLSAASVMQNTKAEARLERQKTLAIKEVEYLRAQIKTFDAEEREFKPEQVDEQKAKRIEELEDIVDKYRAEVESFNTSLSKAEDSSASKPTEAASRPPKRPLEEDDSANAARLGQLSRKNRKLQDQLTALTTTNAVLDSDLKASKAQLAASRSSASSTQRILELRANPTAKCEVVKAATLTTLRAENRALLAQLEDNASVATVPRAALESLRAELADRDRAIADKEKHSLRLKQIFAAKSLEFREAVASLLGYKLDFLPNGRVRVTSMFNPGLEGGAEGEAANSIVFDGENGTMKVSGGEKSVFAGEIRGLIEFWVDGRKEVPCFLAAMTMEFWEKSTRAAKM